VILFVGFLLLFGDTAPKYTAGYLSPHDLIFTSASFLWLLRRPAYTIECCAQKEAINQEARGESPGEFSPPPGPGSEVVPVCGADPDKKVLADLILVLLASIM
jgi:hypothetical protein